MTPTWRASWADGNGRCVGQAMRRRTVACGEQPYGNNPAPTGVASRPTRYTRIATAMRPYSDVSYRVAANSCGTEACQDTSAANRI